MSVRVHPAEISTTVPDHVMNNPMPVPAAPLTEAGAVLQIIERAARDPAVDIGKMRELLAMRKDMMAVEAETAFDAAMTAAQIEMRPVAVDASNPQTKSRYATFGALDGALRPIYTKHGFSLSFGTGEGAPADHVRVTCRIAHSGGHRQNVHLDMPADGKGAKGNDVMTKTHATGAAITYGRRYLEGMIFNIAIAQDDDGNGASDPGETIDAMQARYLTDLIETAKADEKKIIDFVGGDSLETLTLAQFKKAESALRDFMRRNSGRRK